jgi:hypothetical protein
VSAVVQPCPFALAALEIRVLDENQEPLEDIAVTVMNNGEMSCMAGHPATASHASQDSRKLRIRQR